MRYLPLLAAASAQSALPHLAHARGRTLLRPASTGTRGRTEIVGDSKQKWHLLDIAASGCTYGTWYCCTRYLATFVSVDTKMASGWALRLPMNAQQYLVYIPGMRVV